MRMLNAINRVQCFKSFEQDLRSSLIEYLGLLLRIRILVVVPPVVALPMVVPPSSANPFWF
jgi:hypothetical protein